MLRVVEWSAALDRHGTDDAFSTFHEIMMDLFDACFPESKKFISEQQHEYVEGRSWLL